MKYFLFILVLLVSCKKESAVATHNYRCGTVFQSLYYPTTSHGWAYDSAYIINHPSPVIGGWLKNIWDTVYNKDTSYVTTFIHSFRLTDSIYLVTPDTIARNLPPHAECERLLQ